MGILRDSLNDVEATRGLEDVGAEGIGAIMDHDDRGIRLNLQPRLLAMGAADGANCFSVTLVRGAEVEGSSQLPSSCEDFMFFSGEGPNCSGGM